MLVLLAASDLVRGRWWSGRICRAALSSGVALPASAVLISADVAAVGRCAAAAGLISSAGVAAGAALAALCAASGAGRGLTLPAVAAALLVRCLGRSAAVEVLAPLVLPRQVLRVLAAALVVAGASASARRPDSVRADPALCAAAAAVLGWLVSAAAAGRCALLVVIADIDIMAVLTTMSGAALALSPLFDDDAPRLARFGRRLAAVLLR